MHPLRVADLPVAVLFEIGHGEAVGAGQLRERVFVMIIGGDVLAVRHSASPMNRLIAGRTLEIANSSFQQASREQVMIAWWPMPARPAAVNGDSFMRSGW